MKIVTNLLKDSQDELLVTCTKEINISNPMVDRIMEDETVAGVVMTNMDGAPIFTNMTLIAATNYGLAMNKFGKLTQMYVQELDPFDKVLAIRIKTINKEILITPDSEFNIIVAQHARKLPVKNIKNINLFS